MIYRAEQNALMIFNADQEITASISGEELDYLKNWIAEGRKNEFIARLHELKLLPPEISAAERQYILAVIEKTAAAVSPLRSFAAPESIHIDLTTVCPLKCTQCYKDLSEGVEMPFETFSDIIAQAKNIGVFQIAVGGGEPLTVENLHEYINHVTAQGMACTVTTSGFALTRKRLEELKNAKVSHVQVSLNGSNKTVHSYSRGGFDQALAALELLSKSGISFGINWVARMDNVGDFQNMILLARQFKADNINILRCKPSSREDFTRVTLNKDAFYTLADQIKHARGVNIKIDSAFSNLLCYINGNQMNPLNCGCGAGRRFMTVDAYGRFKPCSHMNAVSKGQGIQEYWQNSAEIDRLRGVEDTIGGECSSCRHLEACRGCRAICEKIYDDICAGERNCPAYVEKGAE